MRHYYILFLIFAFILASCCQKSTGYEIIGKTTGYPDSTKIILHDFDINSPIDTSYIIKGKFYFKGFVQEPKSLCLLIKTEKKRESKFLWVENKKIKIFATKGDLSYAKTSGSEIQKGADDLNLLKRDIMIKMDENLNDYKSLDKSETDKIDSLRNIRNGLFEELLRIDTTYIRNNSNNMYSMFLLSSLMKYISKPGSLSLFNNFSDELRTSKYGDKVSDYLNLSRLFEVGDIAGDFSLPDINDQNTKLSLYNDKYVLLEFWSTGCGGCRKENPNLLYNYRKYKDSGFEIISISLDKNKEKWKEVVCKDSMNWINICDSRNSKKSVAYKYSINSIPRNYLINPDRVIIAKDLRGKDLGNYLKELFE